MGITAENVAERYHVSREDQDKYALLSQQRAAKARDEGKLKDEIIPLEVKVNKKKQKSLIQMNISATIQLLKNSKNSVLHSKKMEQ